MVTTILAFLKKHKKKCIAALVLIALSPVLAVGLGILIVAPYKKYILNTHDAAAIEAKHVRVGIVLGAGVNGHGKPYRELEARLDVAAKALRAGQVDTLILSGDNRFENYNEPAAMQRYLVEVKHIAASKLQPDYAGRSTYESCERAAKIFDVHQTIIFSAGSHLPRAIFLCRHFGIQAYGISSNVEANNSTRRELLARVKALYNAYIRGEPTVLGKQIRL